MKINEKILKRMFEIGTGNVPIILSCPHGGFKKPKFIPNIDRGVQLSDRFTLFLTKRIIYALGLENIKLNYIISKIHRIKVDFNRPPGTSVAFKQDSKEAREIHYYFHEKVKNLVKQSLNLYGKCLFIDFHGFTKPHENYQDIIFGNIFSNTLSIKNDNRRDGFQKYWGLSEFVNEFLKHFTVDDGLGVNDINLGYSGGYITHQFYRKARVNAIQIEIADTIRMNLKLTNIFIDDFMKAIINCLKKI